MWNYLLSGSWRRSSPVWSFSLVHKRTEFFPALILKHFSDTGVNYGVEVCITLQVMRYDDKYIDGVQVGVKAWQNECKETLLSAVPTISKYLANASPPLQQSRFIHKGQKKERKTGHNDWYWYKETTRSNDINQPGRGIIDPEQYDSRKPSAAWKALHRSKKAKSRLIQLLVSGAGLHMAGTWVMVARVGVV